MESHLLQMRGLKHECKYDQSPEPFVASFTDAWIETEQKSKLISEIKSHLLQMRGLKLEKVARTDANIVASFTDAWIETGLIRITGCKHLSHLLQMRGLKLNGVQQLGK